MINGGYGRKMVVKELFGKVKIYRLHTRVDNRGSLAYVFDESIDDFKARETRIYSMPKEGTFFGIHYRDERAPMTKFVGYKCVGELTDFYKNGINCYLMMKRRG